jgi:hypothetical protein
MVKVCHLLAEAWDSPFWEDDKLFEAMDLAKAALAKIESARRRVNDAAKADDSAGSAAFARTGVTQDE